MQGRIFDTFSAIYDNGRTANLADERAHLYDNCGPEGYCAVDIFET